jgi:hypothetical protein
LALRETIRQHAETYHGGKMGVDRTLSAIGDLASDFLAGIHQPTDQAEHYSALVNGIGDATRQKIAQRSEPLTCQ